MKKDNAFIQFLVKCNNFGQQELFTSEDLFSNAYNCYCHEVFLPEDLNDPKSVIFHQDLYKQPEKDIIYIKKIDDNLSTRYDIERILQLENIDSRILANRLTSLGIDYDKIVDMLANENYADLRKAVIYDRNGKVRSASTIKEIMDAFKKEGTKIYQKDKDGDTGAISIEQVANKVNRLDREDLVDFANGLNFETISALSNIIKGV